VADSPNSSTKVFRPFAKILLGSDFALAKNSPFYVGVKAGYLALKDYGSFNSGLNLGYTF